MAPPSTTRKGGAGATPQQIIIKRVKKGGHGGHHGGAWKIAYADFVTAMMAFFLLMWLLGSTSKGDLKGIADYFNSPMKVAMPGGSGAGESSVPVNGGGNDLMRSAGQVRNGENVPTTRRREALKAELEAQERRELATVGHALEEAIATNPRLSELRSQIQLDLTQEGLRIQIVDAQNRPMFDTGSAAVKDYMRELLRNIGKVLNNVPNRITLAGHTDPSVYVGGDRGYSNWELSADRANASRRELVAGGLQENKLLRVVGLAAALPLDPADPRAAVNRRISITVMNSDAEERVLNGERFEFSAQALPEDQRSALEKVTASGN
jgi:chemotaxis protein MotB